MKPIQSMSNFVEYIKVSKIMIIDKFGLFVEGFLLLYFITSKYSKLYNFNHSISLHVADILKL